MAFLHGASARVYASGYDITSYLSSFGITINGEAVDVTTLSATWHDVIAGLRSASFTGSGFIDNASATTQEAIITALTNVVSSIWMYWPQGDAIGKTGFGLSGVQTSYNPTSP